MAAKRRRKYRNIIQAVYESPWVIVPSKLRAIMGLIELRAAGGSVGPADVRAVVDSRRQPSDSAGGGRVAVISVIGTLMPRGDQLAESSGAVSCDAIGRAFDQAIGNSDVSAVVFDIHSPGGCVHGVADLAAKIFAARGTKPIVAVANSEACSGAYWFGAAADTIVVNASGDVGSIGVLSVHQDYTRQNDMLGIDETVIAAGPHKAEMWVALSEEAKAAIQQRVDAVYRQFVTDVARFRGVSEATVKSNFGGGRVVLAADAVAAGMADRIGTLDEVLRELGAGAQAAGSRSGGSPAYSLKGITMNPKIFGALVRVGMCAITATHAEADAALARFFAAKGQSLPTDEAAQLAALEAHIAAAAVPPAAPVPVAAAIAAAAEDRAADILAAVRLANVPNALDLANTLIADKTLSLSAALKRVQEAAAAASRSVGGTTIVPGAAELDKFHVEARDALLVKSFGGSAPKQIFDRRTQSYIEWQPSAGSRQNFGLRSGLRLAEACLAVEGYSRNVIDRLAPMHVAQLAMGVIDARSIGLMAGDGPSYNVSGMFRNILLDASNVALRRSYDDARTTFQVWMKQGESLTDFKLTHKVIAGELSDPKAIPEDGEFEEATMSDGKESYRLVVWGNVWSLSWQAVVNDQLGAFVEAGVKQARGLRRKQNRLGYSVLKDNATMADTGALFNTTAVTTAGGHANKTTGAASPTVAVLNAMTNKMMIQRGLNTTDGGALNLMPRFLLHPPALRGTVLELLGSTSNPASSNANVKNIWENGLEPVTEAELGAAATGGSDTGFYLAADAMDVDTIEYAYLQGLETPALDQAASFDRLALRQRIYQAFAVKALDFRGLQLHTGA